MMNSTYLLLLLAACILSKRLHKLPETRITNGNFTHIESVPWQVSIQVNGEHHCGGSLISDRIILTAAHCFYWEFINKSLRLLDDKEFLIVAGSKFKRSRETIAGVSAKIHHDDFSIPKFNNDIGIMKLVNPLPLSSKVRMIGLATDNPTPGFMALTSGWGSINGQKSDVDPLIYPEILQSASIPIGTIASCNISGYLREDQICAGSAAQTSCSADFGSPLVFNNKLVGVFSRYSQGCASAGFYASVAFYNKWIINAMKTIFQK